MEIRPCRLAQGTLIAKTIICFYNYYENINVLKFSRFFSKTLMSVQDQDFIFVVRAPDRKTLIDPECSMKFSIENFMKFSVERFNVFSTNC